MLSRFLRSAIQTTDSTLMGCRAKSAATIKLRPAKPVACNRIQNKQPCIQGMQQNIGGVVAGRVELKKLAIQSVGKPGHRMPVGRVVGGESPRDRIPGEPRLNVDVVSNIGVVVVIDEGVMNRRVVENDGGDDQDKAENQGSLLRPSEPGPSEAARCRLRRSALLRFLANMFGFQTSSSHSSPVFDEYIRWGRSACD